MAACTPATNAVDKLIDLIDQLDALIVELRRQDEQKEATELRYAGVRRMTHATWSSASGEHQPCSRWAACSAGMAAERKSGYRAM